MPLDFESGVQFFGFDEASDEALAKVPDRPFRFGHYGCDGKYRMSDDEKRGTGLMTCPYCGCECDRSAVGDHAIDCEGYGENARTGPDEPD